MAFAVSKRRWFRIMTSALISISASVGLSASAWAEVTAPVIEGVWQQGSILRGQLADGERLYFLDREVPVSPDGFFVLGLGRDFADAAVLTVKAATGDAREFRFPVKPQQYNIQRVEGVPQQTVTPDPKHLERIRKEAAQVAAARKDVSELQAYRQEFTWPLLGRISGVYGSQRYYNGNPGRPHYGVDVAAPTGTLVRAPADGVVRLAHKDMFFSGGTLIVDHGQGLSSTFMHLHKLLVEEGQTIKQGDEIAEVGATGRATGPHLDWRMNWFDQQVDPTFLVPSMSAALAAEKASGSAAESTDKAEKVQ
jgi:murein DD-endopeptidase MepM/ murein hydrolase activator NlpD